MSKPLEYSLSIETVFLLCSKAALILSYFFALVITTDFINREADCSSSDSSDNYSSNDEDNDDLASFITDDNGQEDSISFYRDEHTFENQVRPTEDCDDPEPYLYSGDLMDADIHSISDEKLKAKIF